jgi:hypothetical protein
MGSRFRRRRPLLRRCTIYRRRAVRASTRPTSWSRGLFILEGGSVWPTRPYLPAGVLRLLPDGSLDAFTEEEIAGPRGVVARDGYVYPYLVTTGAFKPFGADAKPGEVVKGELKCSSRDKCSARMSTRVSVARGARLCGREVVERPPVARCPLPDVRTRAGRPPG